MELKKIIKKEEFFLDKNNEISSVSAPQGIYTRITFKDGFKWFNKSGNDITDGYRWGVMLEEEYQSLNQKEA